MNEPQKQTIEEIKKLLPIAHFIDIRIRINGEWKTFEGDFLKEILSLPVDALVTKSEQAKPSQANGAVADRHKHFLEHYLLKEMDEGKIDFHLRVTKTNDGLEFYIHPQNASGETLDFWVEGNRLFSKQHYDMIKKILATASW